MKKAIAILLVLVLVLGLWACGSATTSEGLTEEEKKYAGTWISSGDTLYLYDDGIAIRHYQSGQREEAWQAYGTWDLRDGYIMYYYLNEGYQYCKSYKIIDEHTMEHDGETYNKR